MEFFFNFPDHLCFVCFQFIVVVDEQQRRPHNDRRQCWCWRRRGAHVAGRPRLSSDPAGRRRQQDAQAAIRRQSVRPRGNHR